MVLSLRGLHESRKSALSTVFELRNLRGVTIDIVELTFKLVDEGR